MIKTCDYQVRARARIRGMNRAELYTKATQKVEIEEKQQCYADGAARHAQTGDVMERVVTLPTGGVVTHNQALALIEAGMLDAGWYMKSLKGAYNRSFAQHTIKTKQMILAEVSIAQMSSAKTRKAG